MPLFQLEADGKRFEVEAPDAQTAAASLHAHTGSAPSMVQGAGDAFVRGMPVVGGIASKANAAIDAGLAPFVDPPSEDLKLTGKTFGERYQQALDIRKVREKSFSKEHPIADAVAEIAGGVASTGAVGATATGAKMLGIAGKTLPQMIGRGAASGAGIDVADAALHGDNPLTAGAVGGTVGAVAPVVGRVVNAKLAAPVGNLLRGIRDPAGEAERRVATALDRDIRSGGGGLTSKEFVDAQAAGTPVNLMDVGGETTRALARSAANTSQEGRGELNRAIDERFASQSPRLVEWLQHTFHFPNADAQQQALDKVAKTVNRPAYAKAYHEGDRDIMSPELDRLMGSPAVVEAMRKASTSGKDRAITQGVGAMRQGVTVENGLVNFTKGKNGVPTYPNLAFWDATKRELDDATNAAMRAGRREEASTLTALTKSLRDELDTLVPSYNAARAGAAKFFGAGDALEAGQNFVGASQKFGIPDTRRALAKMSPEERQLFQDGYVSRLVETIDKNPDRRNILNRIAGSPAAREEINVALGRERAAEVEARLRVEGIMDLARSAVQGNSTTARQLHEIGIAGGFGAGGAVGAAFGGPVALLNAALVYGAAKGHRVIDERVSNHVAKLLASDDIRQLQKGIRLLSRNENMMRSVRNADAALGAIGARGATPAISRDLGAQ